MRTRCRVLLRCLAVAVAAVVLLPGTSAGRSMTPRKRMNITTPRPSTSSASAGLGGYRRFHANDTLVGKEVPCTRDQKVCFRYNLVFDATTDRCQPIGGGYAPGCDLRINKTEFERGSGRVIGICQEYEDPCPGYRMAHDGRCYRKEVVRDVICGCQSELTPHFLGGVECRCSPAVALLVKQPLEDGRCRIPDLRFPDVNRTLFVMNRLSSQNSTKTLLSNRTDELFPNCSRKQRKCFSQGKVWVTEGMSCSILLDRGPCAKGYVVVLSREAGAVSAICMHVNGSCQPGFKKMAFDGQCHNEREMFISVPGRIELDIFGGYVVVGLTEVRSNTPAVYKNDCVVLRRSVLQYSRDFQYRKPPCDAKQKSLCLLHEVHTKPPLPE